MAKGKIPPALRANADRMKAGKPLAKKSSGAVPAKNAAKRGGKGKSGR